MTMNSQLCGVVRLYLLNHTFPLQTPDDLGEKICLIFFFSFPQFSTYYYYFVLKFCTKTKHCGIFTRVNILFLPFSFFVCFWGCVSPRALHSPALIRTDRLRARRMAAVPEFPFIIPDFSPASSVSPVSWTPHFPLSQSYSSFFTSISSSSFFIPLFLHYCVFRIKQIFSSVRF